MNKRVVVEGLHECNLQKSKLPRIKQVLIK